MSIHRMNEICVHLVFVQSYVVQWGNMSFHRVNERARVVQNFNLQVDDVQVERHRSSKMIPALHKCLLDEQVH